MFPELATPLVELKKYIYIYYPFSALSLLVLVFKRWEFPDVQELGNPRKKVNLSRRIWVSEWRAVVVLGACFTEAGSQQTETSLNVQTCRDLSKKEIFALGQSAAADSSSILSSSKILNRPNKGRHRTNGRFDNSFIFILIWKYRKTVSIYTEQYALS